MCGRFALGIPRKRLEERFLLKFPQAPPRYNLAPGQLLEAVVQSPQGREPRLFTWGLVPSWAKDPGLGSKMINARAETVALKPAFKAALRRRRCLIPAQGFYEWSGMGGQRQPWFITAAQAETVLALAGIWELYQGQAGEIIESVAIITCQANELMAPLHQRMPVLVDPGDDARWLDPNLEDPKDLRDILAPRSWERMRAYPVSPLVNSPKNQGPELIKPLEG